MPEYHPAWYSGLFLYTILQHCFEKTPPVLLAWRSTVHLLLYCQNKAPPKIAHARYDIECQTPSFLLASLPFWKTNWRIALTENTTKHWLKKKIKWNLTFSHPGLIKSVPNSPHTPNAQSQEKSLCCRALRSHFNWRVHCSLNLTLISEFD